MSAFNDHYLHPYEQARAELVLEHIDNPQGFYRADAELRRKLGLLLTPENEAAILDGIRRETWAI